MLTYKFTFLGFDKCGDAIEFTVTKLGKSYVTCFNAAAVAFAHAYPGGKVTHAYPGQKI